MKKLEINCSAPDFCLPGVDGKDYCLAEFSSKTLLVVVFTCNHCPYAQAYEPRLVAIQQDYLDRGVQLVAINPNDAAGYPEDNFGNMVKRAETSRFNFPYLRDEAQHVARAYGAEYTPEAYLFNRSRQLCYLGRIDDNWQHPEKIQSHDLRQALDAVLVDQPVQNPVTHAIGCTIKWKL